ncbi:MAG TPA: dTMP kinase [Dehalococcoidia bacterium]|nr:dTMP kinase [Dehalococcoidia bacterium]
MTLEGGEGAGKSFQARALGRRLRELGVPYLLTYEPGATELGLRLRELLMDVSLDLSPWTELFLFAADRAQHVQEVLRPALAAGQVVLCERFSDSTIAYQGYGRGLPLEQVRQVCGAAADGLVPDLTFLLDVPPEVGLARKKGDDDRFRHQALDFHRRVREGYLALAREDPRRIVVVDAALPQQQVTDLLWEHLLGLLPSR